MMHGTLMNRHLLAAVCITALPLAAAALGTNQVYDPLGLSAQPRGGTKPARMLSREEIRERLQTATAEPFTPLVFGVNDRFYNQSLAGSGQYNLRRYDEWQANYHSARTARAEFAGLDDYDQWFRNIPGAGVEFAWKMQAAYLDGMPANVKDEYEQLMRERAEARSAAAASESEARAKGLVITGVKCVGTEYVALLPGGRVVSEGDLVRSHHQGFDYTWRAARITEGGAHFAMVEKRWRLSGGERALTAAVAFAVAALLLLLVRGWLARRRGQPPRAGVTNALAVGSLVLGILGLLVPFNTSVLAVSLPAVLFGHIARRRRHPGTGESNGFRGIALAGLCLGYIGIVITALFLYAVWEPACRQNLRVIKQAKEAYIQQYHRAPDTVAGLVPDYLKAVPRCPALGRYTIGPEGTDPQCSFPGHRINARN